MGQEEHDVIIPANIRYCNKLTMGARLLYGEIAFICNRDGFCQARNEYFAKLYKVNVGTISSWIKSLQNRKFIKCRVKQNFLRLIFLKGTSEGYIKGLMKNQMGVNEKPNDNYLRNYREGHSQDAPPLDDFNVVTEDWVDEAGQKRGIIDTIDYEA